MNETSVRPAESSEAPWGSSWSSSSATASRSSSTSIGSDIGSDTAKVEFAPCSAAGRREGDDGDVKLNDGLIVKCEYSTYRRSSTSPMIY